VTPTFDNAEDVLREYLARSDAALIILTDVTGGTLRARGAMMCVTASRVIGYMSNGCVDADIIARARAGESGTFTYGEGSPYRDITLPCGGRLEIAILQNPDREAIGSALAALDNRTDATLDLEDLSIGLVPHIELRIAGRGAACIALAELAELSGFDVSVQSPEADVWPTIQHLIDPAKPPATNDDTRTAVVCLFHDHDWEAALLQQALAGPAFYIGAMGSQRTHDMRCKALTNLGSSAEDIARIKGPIGLVPAQRDARLLALSILAEIMQSAQQAKLL